MSENAFKKGYYTNHSTKIGLFAKGERTGFLTYHDDVVLNFPFKDCVLEAGMNKEDNKREDERFLHQSIDERDIDTLFEPKVLTNYQYHAQNGIISNQQSAISNQQSAISNQQSAISNQQSAISNQQSAKQSAISNQQSAISNQQSAISNQQSAISNQQSAISNQQSAISNQQSAISLTYLL